MSRPSTKFLASVFLLIVLAMLVYFLIKGSGSRMMVTPSTSTYEASGMPPVGVNAQGCDVAPAPYR
jgi:hypothetical protein